MYFLARFMAKRVYGILTVQDVVKFVITILLTKYRGFYFYFMLFIGYAS